MTFTEILQPIPGVLLPWYDRHRRTLPWREEVSPYRTWVSEIMLQQTRVQAVMPYFSRFLDAAPDILTLSRLPEEQLLRLWQGLGYYSRARNLQRAAQVMVAQHGGCMPQTYNELIKLPGIGDYTAGAILSIAFNQAVPAVDPPPRRQRASGGAEFPHAEGELPETLAAQQLSAWGLRVRGWRRTLRAAHQFTHRRWEMTGYLLDVEGDGEPDWLWADEAAMEAKAIHSAFKAFTAALREESSENP